MAKERSVVADYATYLAVRAIICLIQALSLRAAWSLAGGLAWIAELIDRRHRLIACENLRLAFPERFAGTDPGDCVALCLPSFLHATDGDHSPAS